MLFHRAAGSLGPITDGRFAPFLKRRELPASVTVMRGGERGVGGSGLIGRGCGGDVPTQRRTGRYSAELEAVSERASAMTWEQGKRIRSAS